MRDGHVTGHGVFLFEDGTRYEGEIRDEKPNGRGVYAGADGSRYDGEWRDGQANGQGTATYANGIRYDGSWRDGKPDGYGEALINGNTYRGNWAGGCFRDGDRRAAVGRPLSACP